MSPPDVTQKTEHSRPKFLFHGSPRRDLVELCPNGYRALHASGDIRFAISFLARPDHFCCLRNKDGVHVWIGEDKDAFRRRDHGGSIYVVDSAPFSLLTANGSPEGEWEYTTNEPVKPLMRIDYVSALAAFVAHGVRVHFVKFESFARMSAANSWPIAPSKNINRGDRCELASGILPVCRNTGRICLAWRSRFVRDGDCWGTIGGAAPLTESLRDSAVRELREETGYTGEIELQPAYAFIEGSFQYHNFVGLVPDEFTLSPCTENSWETLHLAWRHWAEWQEMIRTEAAIFHPGVLCLFRHAAKLIESVAAPPNQNTHQGFNSDSERRSGCQPSNTGTSYSRPGE